MTNLDYEQRMSALNQLIHETLGVSLNTVRAAYGRARNASITVKSAASETGKLPVSCARPVSLTDLVGDRSGSAAVSEPRLYKPAVDAPVSHFPILDKFPGLSTGTVLDSLDGTSPHLARTSQSRSFLSRFRSAENASEDQWQSGREDALPMVVFSNPGHSDGVGETASDWHKLRNEFWSIAQHDSTVMERYKRDVLG